jgi:hypothetical protein
VGERPGGPLGKVKKMARKTTLLGNRPGMPGSILKQLNNPDCNPSAICLDKMAQILPLGIKQFRNLLC